MKFNIDGAEILQKRNKRSQPCVENWEHYDVEVFAKHLNNIKCRSPYQNPSNEYPICNTTEEMKKLQFNLMTGEINMYRACKRMKKVNYTFKETNLEGTEWTIKYHFWVESYFRDTRVIIVAWSR